MKMTKNRFCEIICKFAGKIFECEIDKIRANESEYLSTIYDIIGGDCVVAERGRADTVACNKRGQRCGAGIVHSRDDAYG